MDPMQSHSATKHAPPQSSRTVDKTEHVDVTAEDEDDDTLEIATHGDNSEETAVTAPPVYHPVRSDRPSMWSQVALLASMTIANFSMGSIVSIQAYNFPAKDPESGSVPFESCAFLFGLFELLLFIACPLYANQLSKVRTKRLLNAGILITSTSSILFGLANSLTGEVPSVLFSLLFRLVQAFGEICYIFSSFSIVAKEFPSRPGVIVISIALATMSGIGVFLGQYTGKTLIAIGGNVMPYATFGSILNFTLFITSYLIPFSNPAKNKQDHPNIIVPITIPTIYLSMLTLIGGACCFGFGINTFIHHMKQFQLNRTQNMVIYVSNILVIIVVNPLWGWLCYKWGQTKILSIFAAMFICIAFSLHGPAPFLPFHASLSMSIVAMVCQGVGIGGEVVCSCFGNINDARSHGYPDSLETKNLMFTLGCSGYYIGVFVGSSIGVLMSITVGYRMATFFIVIGHAMLVVVNGGYEIWKRHQKGQDRRKDVNGIIHNEVAPLIADFEHESSPSH